MARVVIALLLLAVMAQEIRFESFADPPTTYMWRQVLGLSYSRFAEKTSCSQAHAGNYQKDYRIRIVVEMSH